MRKENRFMTDNLTQLQKLEPTETNWMLLMKQRELLYVMKK